MKVLIVGSGGREHALAWKASQSPRVHEVLVAPGNAGTENDSGMVNVDINANDINALTEFAQRSGIDLTIIGPEGPLVEGIVDEFQQAGLMCFGPSKDAAQLEGSKTFTKEFLSRHLIPTAAYGSFTELPGAIANLESVQFPVVIKADGLAAGKGVIICKTMAQGKAAVTDMLSGNRFGEAGHRVVIEEFLPGEEASFICMTDGKNILALASSQDHKAAYNGDTGPNTGGMGAYSPAPIVNEEMHDRIMQQIMIPTVAGLALEGIPYVGFLYAGIMVGDDGVPRVLEYNCRLGDPETQPIMMRLQSDLVELCLCAVNGNLGDQSVKWDKRPALGVVMAAEGYPGSYGSGQIISGLNKDFGADAKIFHAGTRTYQGKIVTSGGRVLCATALGREIRDAKRCAYEVVKSISWDGCWYRDDIGYRALNHAGSSLS